jgi:hypothetical protein
MPDHGSRISVRGFVLNHLGGDDRKLNPERGEEFFPPR